MPGDPRRILSGNGEYTNQTIGTMICSEVPLPAIMKALLLGQLCLTSCSLQGSSLSRSSFSFFSYELSSVWWATAEMCPDIREFWWWAWLRLKLGTTMILTSRWNCFLEDELQEKRDDCGGKGAGNPTLRLFLLSSHIEHGLATSLS